MDDARDDERRPGTGRRGESGGRDPNEGPFFAGVGVLCETAARLAGVDGAAVAALMSAQSRELVHATDAVARRLDELQFAVGEGPCLDAYQSQSPQLWPRLDVAGPRNRWMAFGAGAQGLGVQAVFAFPVAGSEKCLGVLEFYRRKAGPLTDEQVNYATICAASIGHTILSNFPRADSAIEAALRTEAAMLHPSNPFSRAEVYIASGMIALHLEVSPNEALSRIRARAYAHDLSITRMASDIVARRTPLDDWGARERDDGR